MVIQEAQMHLCGGSAQKHLHLLVELLIDPTDGGLDDHRVQGLIDPAALFEDRGEEAAAPQSSLRGRPAVYGICSARSPTWVVRVRGR